MERAGWLTEGRAVVRAVRLQLRGTGAAPRLGGAGVSLLGGETRATPQRVGGGAVAVVADTVAVGTAADSDSSGAEDDDADEGQQVGRFPLKAQEGG